MRLFRWQCAFAGVGLWFTIALTLCRASDEPYCGLYAVHAALHALGHEAEFEGMVDAKYLSGSYGSTAADLITLAEKYGATAEYRTQLTIGDLRSSQCPIVLHTTGVTAQAGFHHWILFLGMEGASVKIYDPPRGLYLTSSGELLSCWDGSGVFVGNQHAARALPLPSLEIVLAFLLVCIAGAFSWQFPVIRRRPAVGFVAVAVAAGVAWHLLVDYGFVRSSAALANVSARFDQRTFPLVSLDDVRKMVQRKDVTFVDARLADNYESSHLPGAISAPIDLNYGALAALVKTIEPEKEIVVYCKSSGCRWADVIANQLAARGYSKVSIFREGMDSWEAAATSHAQEEGGRDIDDGSR